MIEPQDTPKTRVFLSYSRKDAAFVEALLAALIAADYEAYLDRKDIAPGENWRARLEGLILQADAVVFVLTDHSLASDICGWEVERTLALGKRLVPLVSGPHSTKSPPAVAALNYVFSDAPETGTTAPPEPSARALELLRQALDADIAWVREHARLTARAAEWEQANGDTKTAKLLRRGEAEAARAWMGLRPGPAAPAIPETLTDFIAASETHEKEERDAKRRIIGRAFVKPARQAIEDGLCEHALRLAAAGAVLAEDLHGEVVPECWIPAARAMFESRTLAVLEDVAVFSPDGARVLTASRYKSARIWDAVSGAELACLRGNETWVRSAVFSPDGARVLTTSRDKSARIWDATSGAELACLRSHESWVDSAVFSPDGALVLTTGSADLERTTVPGDSSCKSDGKSAQLWDAASGAELACLCGHEDYVNSAVFSPDGSRVLTASRDKSARIWDATSGAELARLSGHEEAVNSAGFSTDGARVLTASSDNTARLWDAASGAELARLRGHEEGVNSAVFSTDGARVLTASSDNTARIWDAASGAELACLRDHEGYVNSAVFSTDGARVLTASSDNTARIWDVATGAELVRLCGHEDAVHSATFSADGTRVLSTSFDDTARIWDAATGPELACLRGHEEPVYSAVFSPDGSRVLTASRDKSARIWDAASGAELVCFRGHKKGVISAVFSPDVARVLTASLDNTTRIWDVTSSAELACLCGHEQPVYRAVFSPDGARVLTGSRDKTARLWDAASGAELACFRGHKEPVSSAVFSPDGTRVLTASLDNTARIWDAASEAELACLRGHETWVRSAVFSPDGARVLTASRDKSARIWDAATGAELARLCGHKESLMSAVFSVDGARVLTASSDNTARIWDAASGAELARLRGHEGGVSSAVFSPDGSRVLSASFDNTARLWDVSRTAFFPAEPGTCLAAALAAGIGLRTESESHDFLMQNPTPKDLFGAVMHQLGQDREGEVERVAAALRAPLHPNCYMSPTQFAEKFGAARLVSEAPESETLGESGEGHAPPDPVTTDEIVGEPPKESGDESRAVQENKAAAPPVTVVRKGLPLVWVGGLAGVGGGAFRRGDGSVIDWVGRGGRVRLCLLYPGPN